MNDWFDYNYFFQKWNIYKTWSLALTTNDTYESTHGVSLLMVSNDTFNTILEILFDIKDTSDAFVVRCS